MGLLEKYIDEIKNDTKIDEMNIKQQQLILPSKKHFWNAKLILHEREMNDLKKLRIQKINELAEKFIEKSPVVITKKTAIQSIENLPVIQEIDKKIEDLEYVIELLAKTEQIFKTMSYDIKNIIDINKMEQL